MKTNPSGVQRCIYNPFEQSGKNTIKSMMVWTLRTCWEEKCQEWNVDLLQEWNVDLLQGVFIDLTKTSDSQSWEPQKIKTNFGYLDRFIAMAQQFHDGLLARVQNGCEFSDPLPVTLCYKYSRSTCVLPCRRYFFKTSEWTTYQISFWGELVQSKASTGPVHCTEMIDELPLADMWQNTPSATAIKMQGSL